MSKRAMSLVLIGLALASSGGRSSADAGRLCVNYSFTGPGSGTTSSTHCEATPNQFDFPVSAQSCRGIPPAGVVLCVGGQADLPLP